MEKAHMIFFTSVCAAFRTILAPFLRHHNPEHIIDQIHFDLPVNLCGGRERWRCVDLNQPRFQIGIDQHIETIKLEAVLIIDHNVLHCFQADPNDIVDFIETFVGGCLTLSLFKVKFQVLNCPFATVFIVVVACLFRDGYICQVNEHIFALIGIIRVLFNTKTCET